MEAPQPEPRLIQSNTYFVISVLPEEVLRDKLLHKEDNTFSGLKNLPVRIEPKDVGGH